MKKIDCRRASPMVFAIFTNLKKYVNNEINLQIKRNRHEWTYQNPYGSGGCPGGDAHG